MKGQDDDEAEEDAFVDMSGKFHRVFFDIYGDFLVKSLHLRKSKLNQRVLEHAVELHKRDVPAKVAVHTSIKKYRYDFDPEEYVRHASEKDDSDSESDEQVSDSSLDTSDSSDTSGKVKTSSSSSEDTEETMTEEAMTEED